MGDTFFSKDAENVYSEMIEQVNKGQRLTIEDVDLYSLDEVGFKKFDTPLTLGNYVPWTDLYRVLGYIYALLSIITILVSSIVFFQLQIILQKYYTRFDFCLQYPKRNI